MAMIDKAILFLAFVSIGCAAPRVYQTMTYPGMAKGGGDLVVREVNRLKLEQECLSDDSKFDDESRISYANKERLWGCHSPGEIWYLYGKACILAHELCHEADLPLEVCDGAFHTDNFCR